MADVSRARERGQLILVTGVILAVSIVGLALVLNSVIFTENLATRNQEHESNGLLVDRSNTRADFAESLTHVNDDVVTSSRFDWLRQNLSDVLAVRENRTNRRLSTGGATVEYDVVAADSGARIRQTNASRNFTAGGSNHGDDDWTVVSDAETLRHFRLTANRGSLWESSVDTLKSAIADSAFNVVVTDADGKTWRVYMFRGAVTNNVYVLVEDPSDDDFTSSTDGYTTFLTEACAYSNDTVTMWLTEGVVQNSQCDQLTFLRDDAVYPLTIKYENVEEDDDTPRIRGTYDLLVDKDVDSTDYHDAGTGRSPFVQQAIVGAQVEMHYRGQETEYYTDIQAEPTWDSGGVQMHTPKVDTFEVEDDSSDTLGGAEFTMNWTVSDEDGDLDQVELILTKNTIVTDFVLDRKTVNVSGATVTDTTTLSSSSAIFEDDHRIEIRVTDEEGTTANEVIVNKADGDEDV